MPNRDQISQRSINCCIPQQYQVNSGDIVAVIYPDGQSEVLCGYAVRRDIDDHSVIACSLKEKDRFDEELYHNTLCGYNARRESISRY